MRSNTTMIENTIIYLIGLPGAGKLTIAREIQKHFDSILVDNHYVNNVVFKLIDTDGVTPLSPRVWDYTKRVRELVLNVIRELAQPKRNFIFTNALAEGDKVDQQLYQDIVQLAQDRQARLLTVRILVSKEELCKRVGSSERKSLLKSIDQEDAARTWDKYEVLKPKNGFDLESSSELSPEQAAIAILDELRRRHGA